MDGGNAQDLKPREFESFGMPNDSAIEMLQRNDKSNKK